MNAKLLFPLVCLTIWAYTVELPTLPGAHVLVKILNASFDPFSVEGSAASDHLKDQQTPAWVKTTLSPSAPNPFLCVYGEV